MSLQFFRQFGEGNLYSARTRKDGEDLVAKFTVADLSGPSMTRQEFTDECDINKLMERYETHKYLPGVRPEQPLYCDFVGMPDLASAMVQMMDAETAFMSLPARVRKEFDNDPLRFVEYAQNGDNIKQMREWGLAPPEKPADAPIEVRVVPDPDAPPIAPAPSPAKT